MKPHAAGTELVSIIIPVYNAGIQLVDALVSAQEQTYRNLEVICVNDGSTDGSLDILNAFADEDPRFRIITKENAGYGAAMNDGLAVARGEWIAILEPDDWMDVDALEAMITFAGSFSEEPDIVKCPYWWVKAGDEFGAQKLNCTYRGLVHPSSQPFGLEAAPELIAHHPSIWSALYRRSFLEEHDIHFPEDPGSGWADNRFLMETLTATDRIIYLDEPFYNYRATSPEDEDAFARKAPLLPFERWQEMTEVLEAANVTDRGIWRAHIRRGFMYAGGVVNQVSEGYPGLEEALEAMFGSMDEGLVLADPAISPALRSLFARIRGIECIRPNNLAYTAYTLGKGLHRIRINGLSATLQDASRFFNR